MNREGKLQMDEQHASLLDYYQDYHFNPVPIDIEDEAVWEAHIKKRRNLYEGHLMVPLSLFKRRSVIEFGCNSGENALYLASLGARLTLVEPNHQVLPRLKMLFKRFGLEQSITSLVNKDIAGFRSNEYYDIVIAECFLNQLSDGGKMFLNICRFLRPGGIGIISFDDRYGSLLELTRQMILKRACQLKGIDNLHSKASLELAKDLYGEDFARLNTSRPFEAWWKDVLVSPFVNWEYLWTYHEFISLLEEVGCEFHSSSPRWSLVDYFSWYKDPSSKEDRHKRLLEDWYRVFPFFLTGVPLPDGESYPATPEVVDAASKLIKEISEYVMSDNYSIGLLSYPLKLADYFNRYKIAELHLFSAELRRLFDSVKSFHLDGLISNYHSTRCLRGLWGVPCSYISFSKRGDGNIS